MQAAAKADAILDDLSCKTVASPTEQDIIGAVKTCFASKNYGMEDFFAPLVAKACLQVMPTGARTFNVDNVRVNKIIGGSFGMSTLVNGMVVPRDTEGAALPHQPPLCLLRCPRPEAIPCRHCEDHGERQGDRVQCGSGSDCNREQRHGADRKQ